MDEINQSQNRSTNEADTSKSSNDEHSFIGKMKFGVSKILPNSISKWLSPRVDGNTRRRRHDELESEEDDDASPSRTAPTRPGINHQVAGVSAPPPSKKQRTFTSFLHQNPFDVTPGRGGPNIISSTLIEDAAPRPSTSQRYASRENGDHSALHSGGGAGAADSLSSTAMGQPLSSTLQPRHSDRDADEASSTQSRDKPVNPFAVNNESAVVNFSAHLQRAKSLFSNRTSVSARLRNFRMRNPRSSLYRSTSSLCDNNSVSSNASSAMSSPFYNGQTTYGGASATSKRLNSSFQVDSQMNNSHRARIPTNLVTSKSTSSLNSLNGTTTSMSNTAKRILDVMSKYNTPLTELRRVSNALPTIAETSLSGKRPPIDLNATNELERTKRALLKPNTPYNRPYGRNETPLTTELHVPSMPELLRLKKFATKTIEIREAASHSDSALNRPMPGKPHEFKLSARQPAASTAVTAADVNDSGATAPARSAPDQVNNGDVQPKQAHRNKIRTNMNKRRMGRGDDDDEMPEQVELPNVALPLGDKKDLFVGFKLQTLDPKSSTAGACNGPIIPFAFSVDKSKPAAMFAAAASKTNGTGAGGAAKRMAVAATACKEGASVSSQSTATFESASTLKRTFTFDAQSGSTKPPTPASAAYHFAKPIVVPHTSQLDLYNVSVPTKPYIFSKPIFVDGKSTAAAHTSLTNFRFEPKAVKTLTSDSGIADTSQSFGSAGNKSTGTVLSKEDSGTAVRLSQASTELSGHEPTLFKSISMQQKQDKWECSACLVSNDKSAGKCACCGTDNPEAKVAAAAAKPLLSAAQVAGKSSKWDCQTCLVPNDAAATKCVCCGEANGNAAAVEATAKLATPQKTFSFGSFSTSSTPSQPPATRPAADSVFKSIVAKQKAATWECSACMTKNDVTKSRCICCDQAKEAITSTNSDAAKPAAQFSFGTLGAGQSFGAAAAPSTSQFSFGSKEIGSVTPSATFSFGNLSKLNETPAKKEDKADDVAKPKLGDAPEKPKLADTPKAEQPPAAKPKETNLFAGFGAGTSATSPAAPAKPKETSANLFSGFGASTSTASAVALGSFAFGKPSAPSPSTSVDATPKPAVDNVLQKIVAEQSGKWECQACMTKNAATAAKCVCCETAKDPSAAGKSTSELAKSSFVFGNPTASTSFTFGAKPSEAKPESAAAAAAAAAAAPTSSLFGSASFGKPASGTASFQFGDPTKSAAASSSPSTSLSFGSPKSTFAASSASATPSFGFSFGSAKSASTDVTDTGASKPADSALAKPNGPIAAAQPLFSFGQKAPTLETAGKPSLKRSNRDANDDVGTKTMALGTTPASAPAAASFVFGQPQAPVASSTFGALASASPASSTPDKPMLFGSPAASTFASPFAAPKAFAFGGPSAAASTPAAPGVPSFAAPAAAASNPAPSQNLFGSNAFATASAPAIGGFGGAAPAFGSTVASPAQSPIVQQQSTPMQPASEVFQFGGNTNTVSSPFGNEPPKLGGFNFTATTTPSFNFSAQSNAQPTSDMPFQFGAPSDAAANLFALPSAANPNTGIQNRRKLRPIRRVNRP